MLHAFSQHRFWSPLVLAVLLVVGCDSNGPDEPASPDVQIEADRALRTTFEGKTKNAMAHATIGESGGESLGEWFSLTASLRTQDGQKEETGRVNLIVPVSPNENNCIAEKRHRIDDVKPKLTGGSFGYTSTRPDHESVLEFRAEEFWLDIVSCEGNMVEGRFEMVAKQSAGDELEHGTVRELKLSNEGQTTVTGSFKAKLDDGR